MATEPRMITAGDKVALGVGLGLALLSLPVWVATALSYPWMGVGIFMRNSLGFWVAAVVLAVAAIGRTRGLARLPRPAEWLALVGVAWGAATAMPPVSHEELTGLVLRPLVFLNLDHAVGRWVAWGIISAVIVVGWGIVRAGRGVLPTAVQTAWLTFLVFLTIWSPLTTLGIHAADWFAPSDGFGRGNGMVLYRGACQWLALTPLGLLVATPILATLADRRRRGPAWTWIELAAAATAGLAATLAAAVFRGEFPLLSLPGLAERGIALAWVAAVAAIDRQLVRWWQRPDDDDTATWSPADPAAVATSAR